MSQSDVLINKKPNSVALHLSNCGRGLISCASMTMTKRICAYLFRLLVLGATASAAIVMAVSHETAHVFFLTIEAKYIYMLWYLIWSECCVVFVFVDPWV
ncbi:hypothetical protein Droror1_Dr00001157 [Drosera rotundifolia]